MSKESTSKKGGFLKSLFNTAWTLGVVGMVLAALQVAGIADVGGVINYLRTNSDKLAECVPNGNCEFLLPEFDSSGGGLTINLPDGPADGGLDLSGLLIDKDKNTYEGPKSNEPYVADSGNVTKESAIMMLSEIRVAEPEKVEYSRRDWKHWDSFEGRSCWNTRKEVLYRDAKPGSVKLVDKDKNPTDNYDEACALGSPVKEDGKVKISRENNGIWIDPYSGEEMTNSSKIDIDHVIPLSYAAKHGGHHWPAEKKQQFANDMDGLLATSARENRTKGDKGPEDYMPPYEPYSCAYAKTFTTMAYKYDLSMTKGDIKVLNKTLASCPM